MMGKLFELLAVETDLANKAKSGLSKTKEKFGQVQLYLGQQRTYTPLLEDGQPLPNENKNLPGTVNGELDLIFDNFKNWMDASVQKEVTNQQTLANIEIEGSPLLENLPAPALLNIENKLLELLKVLKSIPTNDTDQKWVFDDNIGAYISEPRVTYRTEKVMKTLVKYEATEHHPAQTEVYSTDDRIGEWTTIIHSGLMQPLEKRKLVERSELLLLATKRARQRANDIEVSDIRVGKIIVDFLRG